MKEPKTCQLIRGLRICRCCEKAFEPLFTEHICQECMRMDDLDDDINRLWLPEWRTYQLNARKES